MLELTDTDKAAKKAAFLLPLILINKALAKPENSAILNPTSMQGA